MGVVLNDLFDYGLKIYQDEEKFKFSLDSLLLSEYIKIEKSDKNLLDLCTGNAPLPLIIANNYDIKITGVELQKSIYNLAKDSINYNKLNHKIDLLNINAKDCLKYFPGNTFSIITCNPPFFKRDSSLHNENDNKAIARHEISITFEEITEIVSKLLKDNGKFYFVHRPERLEELIILCNKSNLRVKEMVLISSKEEGPINMVLFKCVKNAKFGTKIKTKIINRNIATYKNIFK